MRSKWNIHSINTHWHHPTTDCNVHSFMPVVLQTNRWHHVRAHKLISLWYHIIWFPNIILSKQRVSAYINGSFGSAKLAVVHTSCSSTAEIRLLVLYSEICSMTDSLPYLISCIIWIHHSDYSEILTWELTWWITKIFIGETYTKKIPVITHSLFED